MMTEVTGQETTEGLEMAPGHEASGAQEAHGLLAHAETWLALAFVIFVVLAFKPVKRAILGILDKHAVHVRTELDEARRLREDARKALEDVQRRQRDAVKEAEEILARARTEADRLRSSAVADLEALLKRREAQAVEKIAQAEATAVQDVRNIAVEVAVKASARLLAEKAAAGADDQLINTAIAELPQKLR